MSPVFACQQSSLPVSPHPPVHVESAVPCGKNQEIGPFMEEVVLLNCVWHLGTAAMSGL